MMGLGHLAHLVVGLALLGVLITMWNYRPPEGQPADPFKAFCASYAGPDRPAVQTAPIIGVTP